MDVEDNTQAVGQAFEAPDPELETVTAEDVGVLTAGDAPLGSSFEDLFPDTPTIKKDAPKPDAHRGRIDGVALHTFDSGAAALKVTLTSLDEGFSDDYALFLPAEFAEDIFVNPETLSTETPINERTGKPGLSQRQKYARAVRNSDKTAELQVLSQLAEEQAHTVSGVRPTNAAELAESLNRLLSGVEVVFTRAADKNPEDPAFADRLRIRRIVNIKTASDPRFHKKVRRAWEG